MYQEIVKRAKGKKMLVCIVGVPVLLFVVLEVWFTNVFGLKEHLMLWMKLGVTVIAGGACGMAWSGYFKFGSRLEAMKQTVYAASDEEMEALLRRSTRFERDVFINETYVINFDSMEAYAIKEIRKIEFVDDTENSASRYTLRLWMRESTSDYMHFDSDQSRSKAVAVLKNGM